jgi:hypothetical protein
MYSVGVSRSASLVIAYLMKHENKSLRDAYLHVRQRRRCVSPNNGFWRQLITYEYTLRGENSVHMIKSSLRIDSEMPDIHDSKVINNNSELQDNSIVLDQIAY